MRSLKRTALSIALTVVPAMGIGCVNMSPKVAHSRVLEQREMRMNGAQLNETRGNLAQAKLLYEQIHQQDPQNAECLHRLAVICTRMNQPNVAEVYYLQANALKPNDPEILADMGYAAFLKKDYEQSEALLEKSVKLRENDRRTITNLAIVRGWRGEDESSLAAFRRVTSEAESIRNLAAIQIARGDKEKGVAAYELAKRIDSQNLPNANVVAQTAIEIPAVPPLSPQPQRLLATPIVTMNLPVPLAPVDLPAFRTTIVPLPSANAAPLPPSMSIEAIIELPSPSAVAVSSRPDVPLSGTPMLKPPGLGRATITIADNSQLTLTSQTQVASIEIESPALSTQADGVPALSPADDEAPSKLDATAVKESLLIEVETMYPPVIAKPTARGDEHAPRELIPVPLPQKALPQSVWRKTPPDHARLANQSDVVRAQTRFGSGERAMDNQNVWNICLVTLFEEKRLTAASAEFAMEYQSQQYRFSSAEALERFRTAPERYAPAAGGLDVVSVRDERSVVFGSLNFALWHHRKLYLFTTRTHAEAFRRDPQKYATN